MTWPLCCGIGGHDRLQFGIGVLVMPLAGEPASISRMCTVIADLGDYCVADLVER
ncbi:hypothetical protein Drose_34865 [Dactylosporangium roseum]|uniref:Uncharacterized protein n=1 Tax=Dactylosporangium roseum TaxID=47989 RepID=A0ABY5Z308_9ACTN|nr:hypothetical protein [Dactylosporangium roseum]UWZ36182.1 hypothetical protein Drose_34865 [Dactylosporangium roseum]